MSVKIIDNRTDYDRMQKALFGPSTRVLVGITEENGKLAHGPGGTTILEIAIWNHMGTEHIPSRPFLSGWFDDPANQTRAKDWLKALMPGLMSGKYTQAQMLERLGFKIVGEIQKNMTKGIPPPNAASTIRNKRGKTTTLINTGTLRAKITHVVKTGKDQ